MNVHPSIYKILSSKKTYRNARKFLRIFGLTHSEQDYLIKKAKENGETFREKS